MYHVRSLQLRLDMLTLRIFFGQRFRVQIVKMLAVFLGRWRAFHFQAIRVVSKFPFKR